MALPKPPPRRRFPGLSPGRRPPTSTPERLRRMTKEHEEEERPFDPERPGSWRGSSRELVVNPGQFERDLRELVDASKLAEPDEAFDKAKEILDEGGDPNDVMDELNELLDMHGVEAFPSQKLPHPDFLYLNSGDTYNATLVYSYDENKYFVSTYGDIVEGAEPAALDDAWESWIRQGVERCVRRDIEHNIDLSEAEQDALLGRFDDFDDAELRRIFEESVRDVKNAEIGYETDGSVFVHRMGEVCSETADRVITKLQAMKSNRRRNGEMGGLGFIAALRDLTGPVLGTISAVPPSHTGQLFVNFYNIPKRTEPRDRAELENNRMMFTVTGFGRENAPPASGKVKIEQSLSALPRACRLRAKSGSPEQIARYLAEFLNEVSAKIPPKYTHSRATNRR